MDDIYSMPAVRFFRFARRVAAYDGMLTRRIEAARERAKKLPPARPAGSSTRPPAATQRAAAGRLPEGAKVVPVAAMGLAFPGLIDRRTSAAAPAEAPSEDTTTSDD